tara:strand:+ start:431 stop:1807 length:1377 start_codon:yes stop_codon:yes gene_type:complete
MYPTMTSIPENTPKTPPPPTPHNYLEDEKVITPSSWLNKPPPDVGTKFGLHNHLLSEVTLSSDYRPLSQHVFSKQVSCRGVATEQKSSGRCWLFAALNMVRSSGFIEQYNLPSSFEFSQSYLFFWDKFERVNYLLNTFEETKQEPLDGRLMQFLLKEPMGDGGQWQMFVNLVEKYGLVPKSVYPETKHSSYSTGLNMVLTKKVREYCRDIRSRKSSVSKKEMLRQVYELLVRFLGSPPTQFSWEYYAKDGKFNRVSMLTPLKMYRDVVKTPLTNYVSLIHDPRNEYGKTYGVEHLQNVSEGLPVIHLNVPIKTMATLIKASIDANEPVWFGCDVGQFFRSQSCIMDEQCFNMSKYLNTEFSLNKRERLEFGESMMTHAMLITGYNEDEFGNINRWEIENSWGNNGPTKGYYAMTDTWMREYVYQITVRNDFLSDQQKKNSSDETFAKFSPWDPMGALA